MRSGKSSFEIGGLADLDLAALREHWREFYGSEPPVGMSRELLVQAIAYRIQENMHGGLSRAARLKLAAAGSGSAGPDLPQARMEHRVKPGTRFLRHGRGRPMR